MKIDYYTCIASKRVAEMKLIKASQALYYSRLNFICDIEYRHSSYCVTVELKEDVFSDWITMEEHIRKFVVSYNKTNHLAQDILNLERVLCNK